MPAGVMRPGILQHQDVVRLDVQRGIVDAGRQIFQPIEHHGAALVLEQRWRRRRALQDRAARRQIAEQRDQAATGSSGFFGTAMSERST